MDIHALDFAFPFIVFAYGFIMTVVLSIPQLVKLGEERLPQEMFQRFQSHRVLGLVCLIVGGLWSLQNLWI